MIGLGDKHANIFVYIANKPPLDQYLQLNTLQAIEKDEIRLIAEHTGNHWRKIFNVYAKLMFELSPNGHSTWQILRDNQLLQHNSKQALIFSSPDFSQNTVEQSEKVHIIMGKTYGISLAQTDQFLWVSPDFAIDQKAKTIICPYFDYRQLSNIKITQLANLITSMRT